MSEFNEIAKKGLAGFWVEDSIDPDRLSLHISQIAPGTRAHPPHTHAGAECFYVLEGTGTLETEGRSITISANQAVVIDPAKLHGFVNTGTTTLKYIVVLTKP
jgi:mannose-6-phosphate isomerase-like protein (cupin superfamily)